MATTQLTAAQARYVILRHVAGWSDQQICERYDISRAGLHLCAWGQGDNRVPFDLDKSGQPAAPSLGEMLRRARNKTLKGGGAMSRFSAALSEDPVIQKIIAEATAPRHQHGTRANLDGWFRGCQPQMFGALTVLLVLSDLVDSQGRATFTQLSAACHPAVATAAIPALRTWGFVESDGVNLRLLKTPLGNFVPSEEDAVPYGDDITNPEEQLISIIDNNA